MAVKLRIEYDDMGSALYPEFAPVIMVERMGVLAADEFDRMLDWADDPARPGRFAADWVVQSRTSVVWAFAFTDPRVAMEFKLVWG